MGELKNSISDLKNGFCESTEKIDDMIKKFSGELRELKNSVIDLKAIISSLPDQLHKNSLPPVQHDLKVPPQNDIKTEHLSNDMSSSLVLKN